MDLGEWLLLGGLGCCLLLLVDGYRRVRRRREPALTAQGAPSLQARRIDSESIEPSQTPTGACTPSCYAAALSSPSTASPPSLERDDAATLIGASIRVVGDIDCAESIRIEGRLDGTLAADEHDVVVAAQAQVGPQLGAGTLRIAGYVSGEQHVRGAAVIAPGARVQGTLTANRLACHEGASLQGTIQVGSHRLAAAPR